MTANTIINFNDIFETELSYWGGRFQTVNGNKSSFILNTLTADIRVRLVNRLSMAAGIGQYTLSGFYEGFSNVSEVYPFARYSLGYRF